MVEKEATTTAVSAAAAAAVVVAAAAATEVVVVVVVVVVVEVVVIVVVQFSSSQHGIAGLRNAHMCSVPIFQEFPQRLPTKRCHVDPFVDCLTPSNKRVYLRDGSAQTILCVATLR